MKLLTHSNWNNYQDFEIKHAEYWLKRRSKSKTRTNSREIRVNENKQGVPEAICKFVIKTSKLWWKSLRKIESPKGRTATTWKQKLNNVRTLIRPKNGVFILPRSQNTEQRQTGDLRPSVSIQEKSCIDTQTFCSQIGTRVSIQDNPCIDTGPLSWLSSHLVVLAGVPPDLNMPHILGSNCTLFSDPLPTKQTKTRKTKDTPHQVENGIKPRL